MKGLAADKGLYMPETWPRLSYEQISNLKYLSYDKLAHELITPYVGDVLSPYELEQIIYKSYSSFSNPTLKV